MHHRDVSLMEKPKPVLVFPFLGWVVVNTTELSFFALNPGQSQPWVSLPVEAELPLPASPPGLLWEMSLLGPQQWNCTLLSVTLPEDRNGIGVGQVSVLDGPDCPKASWWHQGEGMRGQGCPTLN